MYSLERAYHGDVDRYGTFRRWDSPWLEGQAIPIGRPDTIIRLVTGETPDNTTVPAALSADRQHYTATATADLDSDPILDEWHINEAPGSAQADVRD